MSRAQQLITENIATWTGAIQARSTSGRGSSNKYELYGIKKLRELILELAVRGKLVPQDSSDEPASVLLERIAAEKAELIKAKKIKKPKALPPITDEEKPFELPEGWEWVRLNEIGEWGAGATPSRRNASYYGGEIPWFKSGELSSDYISTSEESVTELALEQVSLRKNKPGDVLIAMYGATIGKASILSVTATTNQAVCACTPFTGISNIFLLTLLKSYRPRFIKMGAGGAQPNISREKIIATVIALPPQKEQQRIVHKVDELMVLCDQLEQQTESSIEAHTTLVDTLLSTLTNSADADELQQSWARIAGHFDTLFTTERSIDALKQTILQLAVMGKLVRQNPNDEPASVLLKRIAAEKDRLVKEKKIKKQKPLPEISEDEKPFELPNGWVFTTLSHLGTFSGGKTPSKMNPEYWNGSIPWITPKDMKVKRIGDSEDHITEMAIKDGLSYIEPNSLLFVVRSGILRRHFPVALTQEQCTINQDLKALALIDESISEYLLLMMSGFESYILQNLTKTGTTVESLKFEEFSQHYFILPPLAEQQRIVAKIDELMALCDQLKHKLRQSQQTQVHLTDAIVEQALA
ncbi:restriction endonuclease subunit S [Oceanimonas sp. CAM02]|uniref:restriction endonuclease subunit S n=1 Tax=Oceanimonas sp. CAM02 TaxID=3080336 RepID=UPI0029359283|nr:restriction endonuclease subunit S [Oceanimonas sp. CAM02]MDV2858283.1 restriction endonuclease subunit S [Oceanimonas sp. CAM02]